MLYIRKKLSFFFFFFHSLVPNFWAMYKKTKCVQFFLQPGTCLTFSFSLSPLHLSLYSFSLTHWFSFYLSHCLASFLSPIDIFPSLYLHTFSLYLPFPIILYFFLLHYYTMYKSNRNLFNVSFHIMTSHYMKRLTRLRQTVKWTDWGYGKRRERKESVALS